MELDRAVATHACVIKLGVRRVAHGELATNLSARFLKDLVTGCTASSTSCAVRNSSGLRCCRDGGEGANHFDAPGFQRGGALRRSRADVRALVVLEV